MTQSPSILNADSRPLVLDASVIINLVASTYMEGILHALARPIIVTETVCGEFKRHPRDGRDTKKFIRGLTERERIKILELSDSQFEVFLRLTGYLPPDDLGDGEAATIACGGELGCVAIDDKKAIRIALRDFPELGVYSSLDLMCANQVILSMGRRTIADAVYESIKTARMRVPQDWERWVCSLLGKERALQLPALNQTAGRKGKW